MTVVRPSRRPLVFVLFCCLIGFLILDVVFITYKSEVAIKVSTVRLKETLTLDSELDPDNTSVVTAATLPITTFTTEPLHSLQVLKYEFKSVPDLKLKILSAYYDDRESLYGGGASAVVVLGYQPRKDWAVHVAYCSVIYEDGSVQCLCEASNIELADSCNKYIRYAPMISVFHVCKLSASSSTVNRHQSMIPSYISLSPNKDCSDASSKVPIQNRSVNKIKKAEFGVCVQTPIYGSETVQNIFEFIEVHRLLGVRAFTIYTQIKLDEFASALRIYKDIDIRIIQWSNVFKRTQPVHYFGEVLAIHDCLFLNRNRVKYLALVDLDEVITPLHNDTWSEMFSKLPKNENINGYVFHNVLMVPKKTVSDHTLKNMQGRLCAKVKVPKHLKTSKRYACTFKHPRRSKLIVLPDKVQHLDIHSICYLHGYHKHIVPQDIALLFHYRKKLPSDCKNSSWINAGKWINNHNKLLLQMNKTFC